MLEGKSSKIFITIVVTVIVIIPIVWTSISIYRYYTGPKFKVDTYMKHLAKKEYTQIYDMLDQEEAFNIYSKEQIIQYYKMQYDIENNLVEIIRRNNIVLKNSAENKKEEEAFCNIKYVYSNKEQVDSIYLIKRDNEWKIRFPFQMSEVKIYAPVGSEVYLNDQKVTLYENEMYIQKNVLPGKYLVKVDFLNKMYNPYKKTINVPYEKEVFLPYDALNVEIMTIKNMIIELEGIQKKSDDGIAVFNNILEGNYKLKIFSANHYINPIETNIGISKNTRLFNMFDVTLSETGEDKLKEFINDFYNGYLKDIKEEKCSSILPFISKDSSGDLINDFKEWFIKNKDIQDAKITVQPNNIKIDDMGFLHTDLLETIELTNKEFDEYENDYVSRKYKLILEWDTKIDISGESWYIIERTVTQSMVSYKDFDGKWVQY
jgi:hypothetical protein